MTRSHLKNPHGRVLLSAVLVLVCAGVDARGLDDIRLSKVGAETTIEIELGCSMRYIRHSPAKSGTTVRITVSTGQDCRLALAGTWNELRRPVGSRMANLFEIEFDRGNRDQAFITLRFETAVGFEIQQTSNLYMLTVVVDTSSTAPPQPPAPMPAPTPAAEVTPSQPPISNRAPGRQVQRQVSQQRNRFAIRVAVLSESEEIDVEVLRQFGSVILYTKEIAVGERRWAELRLGFFDTEAAAQSALAKLRADFPSAWITVANPEEQTQAGNRRFALPEAAPSAAPPPVATVAVTRPERTLSDDRVATMLVEAQGALLSGDFARGIQVYTRLLEEPGDHRRKAREFLGVAHQKSGQIAQARAEYEAYLAEFPEDADARRVQQRLAAITVPIGQPRAVAASAARPEPSPGWEFYGSASQYYLRGVNMADDATPDFIAQSALLSQAHLYASYRGERYELAGRANLGYLYDFVENGADDQALASYAYLDITDTKYDVNARVGRQLQHSGGVLGRFDGVHASYRLRPDLAINVTAGFPVDSPRFLPTADHYFYGASIELDNFADAWDFHVFTNLQTVDGISDRKAIGAEAQYHNNGLNVVGLLDYDASYDVINTALITGNWRFNDRLTFHGRFRGGAAPFLTTRNAIIGQPVNTVRELLPTYSEGQIRRLARNRTAEERAGSAGLTAALTPRLQLKTVLSYAEYSSTVASGGVDALPETGPRYSWGGHLIGSGFVKAGQVFMIGYRHDETQSVDTNTVWFDLRHPLGRTLRIQSRLSVSNRVANQNPAGDIDQWIAQPVLRLVYTGKRRYRIEFELGGQWSNREFPEALVPPLTPDGEFETSDYYLQLGYTLDF